MVFGFVLKEEDHFDNGTLDGDIQENPANLSEGGTELTLDTPTDVEWGLFLDNNASRFGYTGASGGLCHRFEARATSAIANDINDSEYYTGLTTDPSGGNPRHYAIGYHAAGGSEILLIIRRTTGTQTTLASVPASPPTSGSGAHIYRIYWNDSGAAVPAPEDGLSMPDGYVAIYYSVNNGEDFSLAYGEPNSISGGLNDWGLFGWDQFPRHNAEGGGTATFDYLRRYQYEEIPSVPQLVDLSPDNGDTQVDRDGLIDISIIDEVDDVNPSTIIVRFGSEAEGYSTIFSGESFADEYNGSGSLFETTTFDGYDGYRIVIEKTTDFPSFQTVLVNVIADNYSSSNLDAYYSFRIEDYEPPLLENQSPAPDTTDVDENTLISFKIRDEGAGIDIYDTTITIAGSTAFTGGAFVPPFNGASSSITFDGVDGYDVVVDNTGSYPSAKTIVVNIDTKDNEGN